MKPIEMEMRRKLGSRVITRDKIRNFVLAHRESVAKTIQVKSLPYILNIDTLNACNLACHFCPTALKALRRDQTRLSIDKAKAVIDAVKDHVLFIRLFNWGEPFLDRDIFEIIRYASDAGLYSIISSSLSVKVKDFGERVVDSGLDNLRVSFDGTEQSTLEKYRQRADFELVQENIRSIVSMKQKKGSKRPKIDLIFLVFRHNEHEIPHLPRIRSELGADSFILERACIYNESFVPRHPDFQPMQTIFHDSCHYLYSELMVEADGHISPCCTNTNARFDIGTIDDLSDLPKFWNSPELLAMRSLNAGMEYSTPDGEKVETLCQYCRYIGNHKPRAGKLTPLSPSFIADGEDISIFS